MCACGTKSAVLLRILNRTGTSKSLHTTSGYLSCANKGPLYSFYRLTGVRFTRNG